MTTTTGDSLDPLNKIICMMMCVKQNEQKKGYQAWLQRHAMRDGAGGCSGHRGDAQVPQRERSRRTLGEFASPSQARAGERTERGRENRPDLSSFVFHFHFLLNSETFFLYILMCARVRTGREAEARPSDTRTVGWLGLRLI